MMHTKIYFTIVILSTLAIEDIFATPALTYICPYGFDKVDCAVDPCSTSECPDDPDAKCVPFYCGGCNAVWLTSAGTLAECDSTCKCPPGQDKVQCTRDPCDRATCPGDSTAKCYSNYCGGCNAVWLTPDNKSADCSSTSNCPERKLLCYSDPCQGKTCNRYPDATGVPNYCVACMCNWFLSDGTSVTC